MATLTEVIREAMSLDKSDEVIIETLELRWRDFNLFFASNIEGFYAPLELGYDAYFQPVAIALELPAKGPDGFQELNIAISNVDQQASDFLQQTLDYDDEVVCLYRPFIASDLAAGPQMVPPLELTLSFAEISVDQVNARASFVDILNRAFLTARYTKSSNPSL